MAAGKIRGEQIKDDSLTGDDIDESTLIITTLQDTDGDTKIQIEESADEDKIRFDTAGSERMIINELGRVGIGTNDPDNTLHVESSGTTHIKIVSEAGYEAALKLKSGTGSSAYVWQPGNTSDLRLYVNGADRMHIDNDGNVGIATTNPGELLTINGVESNSDETYVHFTEGGADRAKIGINTSNNLVLHNQFTNKHIVMKVNDNGVTREGLRLNGSVPEVVINEQSESLINFRVESDNNTHMLFVTGSDKVGINDSTPTSTLTIGGSIAFAVLSINAANDPGSTYAIATTDRVILVNTRASAEGGIDSAITLTLPSASSNPGMLITIKDSGGYANENNITISKSGTDKIEGVADTIVLNSIAQFTTLISDGASSWYEIGQ